MLLYPIKEGPHTLGAYQAHDRRFKTEMHGPSAYCEAADEVAEAQEAYVKKIGGGHELDTVDPKDRRITELKARIDEVNTIAMELFIVAHGIGGDQPEYGCEFAARIQKAIGRDRPGGDQE